MTPPQCNEPAAAPTEPFRWESSFLTDAFDHFRAPDHGSQRQYARTHGIPRSTLGSWLREQPADADLDPQLVAFFRSTCGVLLLRRLVLALYLVFLFGSACGVRRLSLFLRQSGLDRFVASSTGALHDLAALLEADLGRFADEERPRLAEGMKQRPIAVVPDENFHGPHVCLVAAEPVSNFLLVEQYAQRRDADTWAKAIREGVAGLGVTVVLVSSDQAKGLIACAGELEAAHLPELFHGQRDLCRPLMGPLQRHKEKAQKELEEMRGLLQGWRDEAERAQAAPARPGRKLDYAGRIDLCAGLVEGCVRNVRDCEARQERALQAVRGLGDDYHPFDSQTGQAVEEAEVQRRLGQRLQELEAVASEAHLGAKAQEALARGRRWVELLVAALGWFWGVTRARVEELDLPEEAQRLVYERLLPGLYWQQAAARARDAEQRRQKEELAERLLAEAWAAGGALGRLKAEEQKEVRRGSQEVVGLFARSSSCVEGRNGRLALFHHGQTRLSAGRLKALTVVHNYGSARADGTTAAERFFGKKPRDLFAWLLEGMPDLPRPATRRPNQAGRPARKAG